VTESLVSAEKIPRRKEVKPMNYAKPEVTLISAATVAIQGQQPKHGVDDDGGTGTFHYVTISAYEADE